MDGGERAGRAGAEPGPAGLHLIQAAHPDGQAIPNPLRVAQGSNCGEREEATQLRQAVGLDWLTLTGPDDRRAEAVRVVEQLHGEAGQAVGKGSMWYRAGLRWTGGARVDWEHRAGAASCKVEFPGQSLTMLEPGAVLRAAQALASLGFKATRVDFAVDFFAREGRVVGLLDDVMGGIERDEVRRFQTIKIVDERRVKRASGRSVTLGNRGKAGGGLQVCVYDKGLEQRTRARGEHERLEARYFKGRSEEAFGRVLACAELSADGLGEAFADVVRSLAFSSLEFTEDTSQRRGRVQAAWWLFWVGNSLVQRIRKVRRRVSFEGWCAWAGRAVLGPLERVAAVQGLTSLDLLGLLVECGSVAVARSRGESDAMGQCRQWLAEQLGGGLRGAA